MIIRPLPDWNETLIRSRSNTNFWRKVDAFLNDTMDQMQYYYGEEMDYDPLLRLRSCLSVFSDTEKTESTANCPMVFDSWSCWNSTAPGTVQEQPCPNFVLGFSPKRPAFKKCMENGEWWRHPETNMTWSNYTQCVNIQDLEFRNTVNIISLSGWSVSLFFMAISLFIFFYFKSLHCGRITMHKNLFMSMSLNNMIWIIWYSCVLFQPEVWSTNPTWCRVLHVLVQYFMITTYSWMLCEGAYLQLLLMNTWGVKRWQLSTLIVCGWGVPALVIVSYALFRVHTPDEDHNCWMDTGDSIWFLAVPVIMAITINLMIVINVIRLIKRKRHLESDDSQVTGGPNNMASTLKAARAALMLIPILGIHFLMMPIRPQQGTTLEYFYEVFAAVSSSYQGFFVSIIFCFINSDVWEILKKKCWCLKPGTSVFYMESQATTMEQTRAPRTTCISLTTSPTTTPKAKEQSCIGGEGGKPYLMPPATASHQMQPDETHNGGHDIEDVTRL